MIIYVDVLFIENLILDFIIILATGIICNCKLKILKMLISSTVGSIYSIFEIVFGFNTILIKAGISFFVIFIAFGYQNKKIFLKRLGVFYLTTITFGGASFMLLFLVKPEKIVYSAGRFLGIYPVKMAIFGGILGFLLCVGVFKMLKKKISKTCEIEISYKGNNVKTKALIDSRKFIKRL